MRVLIVGAGIGGLVTALRLHHAGIDCAVYEQSGRIRELGVGLNLLPYAVAELVELGLVDGLDEIAVRTEELIYAHRSGQDILRRPCDTQPGFAAPRFSVHRGRLQMLLLKALTRRAGADVVQTGCRLVDIDQDTDGVTARLVDRAGAELEPVRGEVLIGADGIHSTVRATMFPTEGPPRWNGVQMWRGATEWPTFRSGRSMVVMGGTAAKLVVYPIGAGSAPGRMLTNWALCVLVGADGDPPPLRQDWSRRADPAAPLAHVHRFRSPHIDHVGLVAATPECFEFPMCDRDPLPWWSRGRVTLLGDAAHPMYPMGSHGAGQAIVDAASLAGALARCPDPIRALRSYQEQRLSVTGELVLRNRAGGPERVIDEVERRAPDGFSRLSDVIDTADLARFGVADVHIRPQYAPPPRSARWPTPPPR
jgi:2-polyprenyl-6-methoxyphenol hydroxylase-like FAD-dependent oxidoreductase